MLSKTKSTRNAEVRWLDGRSYTLKRKNSSGNVSWICQKRCGGWAKQIEDEFRATKPHNDWCEPSGIRKEVAEVKTKINERAAASYCEKPCVE